MRRALALPLSILAGCALIAAGLYLGLRERSAGQQPVGSDANAPSTPAVTVGAQSGPSAGRPQALLDGVVGAPRLPDTGPNDSAGSAAPGLALEPQVGSVTLVPVVAGDLPGPPPASPEVQSAVLSAAVEALGDLKADDMVPRCWVPSLAAAPEPARSTYSVQITFDAEGREIARGVSELRDTDSRSDVANCIGRSVLTLRVPPPGQTVSVVVPLHFP
ncbi:MAG: hypothetical protein AMXMBFR64_63130 [Myxococcales bacterium]